MSFKFCPNCGYKLNGTFKFCPSCGFKLNVTNDGNNDSLNKRNKEVDEINIDSLDKLFSNKIKDSENEKKELEDKIIKAKYYLAKGIYNESIILFKQLVKQDRYNYDYYIYLLTAYSKNFTDFSDESVEKLYQMILKIFPNKKDDEIIIKYNQKKEEYLENLEKKKEEEIEKQKGLDRLILARNGVVIKGKKVFFGHIETDFYKKASKNNGKSIAYRDNDGEYYYWNYNDLYKTKPIEWDILEEENGYYILMSHNYIIMRQYDYVNDRIYNEGFNAFGKYLSEKFFTKEEQEILYNGIAYKNEETSLIIPKNGEENNIDCVKITIPSKTDYLYNLFFAFDGKIEDCELKSKYSDRVFSKTFFRETLWKWNAPVYGMTLDKNRNSSKILTKDCSYPLKVLVCINTNIILDNKKIK